MGCGIRRPAIVANRDEQFTRAVFDADGGPCLPRVLHHVGGAPAVGHVTMDVSHGESVAVMGPPGSGKSTLLNLIAGLDRPTSGEIRVGGERVDTLSETGLAKFRRRQVGMIFQFFNLLDDMTVADHVLLPPHLPALPTPKARARTDELLTALRIGQHRNAYPARLSRGAA